MRTWQIVNILAVGCFGASVGYIGNTPAAFMATVALVYMVVIEAQERTLGLKNTTIKIQRQRIELLQQIKGQDQ